MITADQITREIAVQSLNSRTCLGCGQRKRRHQTFCATCYHALPPKHQQALYRRLGAGYEQAVAGALTLLGVEQLHLPITPPAPPPAPPGLFG